MSKKKDREEELNPEEALNRRVDAMLDPKLPDPVIPKKNDVPPLDIFKDAPIEVTKATKTAPEVAGAMLQKVDVDADEDAKPPVARPKSPKQEKTPLKPKKESSSTSPAASPPRQDESTAFDDQETDRAVDDIAANESDTMLALQDALVRKKSRETASEPSHKGRAAAWTMLLVLAIVMFLLIAPYNSYTCHWPVGIRLRLTTDILPSVCK